MSNIAKKAYIWVKYLFFFGCDPIQSIIFLACFALISTSVYFGLYTLFETLISNDFLACRTYTKGAIFKESVVINIKECSAIDLHLSSKESTVLWTFWVGLLVFISFMIGNINNNTMLSQDSAIVVELKKIEDDENKKKQ